MAYDRYYGNLIWTNHALARLAERGLSQDRAWETVRHPDKTYPGNNGSTQYQKRYGMYLVTAVAKKNEKNEWLVLSCWMDPPLAGTKDAQKKAEYQAYKKAGPWKRIFLVLKRQLGL